ncbi:Na+/H+ antiporter NhaA [Paraconexibacter algicola]|uniref:Na(+)/H(+) antiporter NhaA n=1 Tax=Paraconexibacter algicola TaxID=2133960 RepID=A0A2T4UN75_9ACTN|nr:Na+/H+ antiporter NhaA [Paraconexibacter algicola]PTL60686.1 Na+/H+ antiporter NhaA [Paraconexibacter algicola]
MKRTALAEFLHDEAAGGIVLALATVVALVWANSPLGDDYVALWETKLDLGLELDLHHWINDGLMAIFFFVVGLEIKRELVCGELQDRRTATLPVVAAIGGVALPALLFTLLTAGTPDAPGWAIPAATDIAFAVGVLALLGDRIPASLKLFLLTIAIVDDILAIAIIAVFYADDLSILWLAGSALGLVGMVELRRLGATRPWQYVPLAIVVWVAMHESGVHATIAGVLIGLLMPTGEIDGRNVLEELEDRLHNVTAFAIVPLFALANAGVDLGGGTLQDAASSTLAWAIVLGLVVGKLSGIGGAAMLALRAGWGVLPDGVDRGHVWGAAALGGIGFTVSLFIAQLAYVDGAQIAIAKVGILVGSLVSGALGVLLLLRRRAQVAP